MTVSVPWQRCQFHLQQNAQAYVPKVSLKKEVALDIRHILMRLIMRKQSVYSNQLLANMKNQPLSFLNGLK
jgi:hypothetical protein